MNLYWLPFIGFLIGLIVTLVGGGGGIFYVLMLTFVFKVDMPVAVSTSLATIIPTTLAASVSHFKANNIRIKSGLPLLIGGVFGAAFGAYFTRIIPQDTLLRIFGGFMLLMSLLMYKDKIKEKWQKKKSIHDDVSDNSLPAYRNKNTKSWFSQILPQMMTFFYGGIGGFMAGMLGVSGTPAFIAGLAILDYTPSEIVGTSIFALLGIATVGLLSHLALGQINWLLVVLLASGTTVGAFLGPYILGRIDKEKLERFYRPVFFVMAVGFGLLLLMYAD